MTTIVTETGKNMISAGLAGVACSLLANVLENDDTEFIRTLVDAKIPIEVDELADEMQESYKKGLFLAYIKPLVFLSPELYRVPDRRVPIAFAFAIAELFRQRAERIPSDDEAKLAKRRAGLVKALQSFFTRLCTPPAGAEELGLEMLSAMCSVLCKDNTYSEHAARALASLATSEAARPVAEAAFGVDASIVAKNFSLPRDLICELFPWMTATTTEEHEYEQEYEDDERDYDDYDRTDDYDYERDYTESESEPERAPTPPPAPAPARPAASFTANRGAIGSGARGRGTIGGGNRGTFGGSRGVIGARK